MGLETSATVTFVAYLFLTLGIGFVAQRYTRNLSDYILGGRRLGAFVTALSAGASDMSGWLLMGLPGAVFAFGVFEAWVAVGLIVGAWLNWTFVAGRLRVHTEVAGNALTLPRLLLGTLRGRWKDFKGGVRRSYPVFLRCLLCIGHGGGCPSV